MNDERIPCLHCNQISIVISTLYLRKKKILHLACGHSCAFDLRPMERNEPMGKNHVKQCTCLVCNEPFMTMAMPPFDEVCVGCRMDFGANTFKEVEELVDMIKLGLIEEGDQGLFPAKKELKRIEAAKPKSNPEVVAAGMRSAIDYIVLPLADGFKKSITYVTAKNGLFEVRHSDLCTIVTQPKEVLGVVQEMKEGVTLNLPKFPWGFLEQTISFFRGVCERQKGSSEALVQVWWNRVDKAYELHVPEQKVSGGGVHHESRFDHEGDGNWIHAADIHSHGSSMSAFWSGTDDGDERRVTTERMFGVIGNVNDPIPTWKWRMRTRDGFIDLKLSDVFMMPEKVHEFTVTSKILFDAIDKDMKNGEVILSCPVTPFGNVDVPEEWYEQVKGFNFNNNDNNHQGWGGAGWQNLPQQMTGYIFINGLEYKLEDGKCVATGKKLVKRGDVNHA